MNVGDTFRAVATASNERAIRSILGGKRGEAVSELFKRFLSSNVVSTKDLGLGVIAALRVDELSKSSKGTEAIAEKMLSESEKMPIEFHENIRDKAKVISTVFEAVRNITPEKRLRIVNDAPDLRTDAILLSDSESIRKIQDGIVFGFLGPTFQESLKVKPFPFPKSEGEFSAILASVDVFEEVRFKSALLNDEVTKIGEKAFIKLASETAKVPFALREAFVKVWVEKYKELNSGWGSYITMRYPDSGNVLKDLAIKASADEEEFLSQIGVAKKEDEKGESGGEVISQPTSSESLRSSGEEANMTPESIMENFEVQAKNAGITLEQAEILKNHPHATLIFSLVSKAEESVKGVVLLKLADLARHDAFSKFAQFSEEKQLEVVPHLLNPRFRDRFPEIVDALELANSDQVADKVISILNAQEESANSMTEQDSGSTSLRSSGSLVSSGEELDLSDDTGQEGVVVSRGVDKEGSDDEADLSTGEGLADFVDEENRIDFRTRSEIEGERMGLSQEAIEIIGKSPYSRIYLTIANAAKPHERSELIVELSKLEVRLPDTFLVLGGLVDEKLVAIASRVNDRLLYERFGSVVTALADLKEEHAKDVVAEVLDAEEGEVNALLADYLDHGKSRVAMDLESAQSLGVQDPALLGEIPERGVRLMILQLVAKFVEKARQVVFNYLVKRAKSDDFAKGEETVRSILDAGKGFGGEAQFLLANQLESDGFLEKVNLLIEAEGISGSDGVKSLIKKLPESSVEVVRKGIETIRKDQDFWNTYEVTFTVPFDKPISRAEIVELAGLRSEDDISGLIGLLQSKGLISSYEGDPLQGYTFKNIQS